MVVDVEDVTGLLARRRALLATLRDGPLSKRELEATLDVSRSTIDRAVRSLENADLVARGSGGVGLTTVGEVAVQGFEEFETGLEGVLRASEVLEPIEDVSLPFALFKDAMVVHADRQSPHRPIVALRQFLDDAENVRSIVTGLLPEYVDTYYEQIVDHETSAEIIVQSSVLNELLATYWEPFDEAVATGRMRVYEATEDPPISIKIGDTGVEEVAVVIYGDRGVDGFIRSDRPEAVDWARDIYTRTKEDADLVAPSA
ncbi:MAG: helix-turn-helix transcriptional regulator [Halanaeroarchaeum sp.]